MNARSASDNHEIEAKYIIDEGDIARISECLDGLKEDGQLMIAGTRTISFTDYYFDTPDLLLAYHDCSLRLRERPGHPTKLTFKKSLTATQNGIHNRTEVEGIPTKSLVKDVLSEAPWIAIRQGITADTPHDGHTELMHSIGVYNTFRIENTRTIHTIVTSGELYAEVSLDNGSFRKDHLVEPLYEFEVEFLSGNHEQMPELCSMITSKLGGLAHHKESKYKRGLKTLGMWKDRKRPGSKRYKRWKQELNRLFRMFEQSLDKSLNFTDARTLHLTRVTIRRIITLLNFLPELNEKSKSGVFILENLKVILKHLGKVRDFDVLLENTTGNDNGSEELIALFELKRNEAILKAMRTISAINRKKLRKKWTKFIEKELKGHLRGALLEQHYISLKNRLFRSIAEFSHSRDLRGVAHPMSIRKLHKSRIILKELRYATEYIDILSPGSPEIDSSPYKLLQDALGAINDRYNEIQFHRELAGQLGNILNQDIAQRTDILKTQFEEELENLDLTQLSPPSNELLYRPDLTEIKGIGERTKAVLHSAGIKSIDDLAQLETEQLQKEQEISEQLVARAIREDWIGQARKLAL